MPSHLILTTCLAENSEPLCRQLAPILQEELGQPVHFASELPWPERARLLAAGKIHIGWICGLLYERLILEQEASLQALVAPVMPGKDYANRPVYFSQIVVRRGSPYTTFGDLRGICWGYNETGSFSGYTIVRHHLAQLGEDEGYFGAWVESGSHRNSLEMLLNGRIEATAIDSTLLDYLIQTGSEIPNKLRVINSLGPHPSPPVVVSTHLPGTWRRRLQSLLTNLHHTEKGRAVLAAGGLKQFTAVSAKPYFSLYEMSQV